MKKITDFVSKYKHGWTVLYVFIYMPWFMWLESHITKYTDYTNIHIAIDDKIPFCEYFIIPYLLWFIYIPVVFIYILRASKSEYYKMSAYFFIGMSISLLVCTLWPNGQDLRVPDFNGNDNVFTKMLSFVYTADTNTNVFPSIHVFNSIGAFIVLMKCERLKGKHRIKIASAILSTLIILSTMLLKQHSIVDVFGGIALSIVMYVLVYVIDYATLFGTHHATERDENTEKTI